MLNYPLCVYYIYKSELDNLDSLDHSINFQVIHFSYHGKLKEQN